MPGIIKDGQSGYYLSDLITLPGIRKQGRLLSPAFTDMNLCEYYVDLQANTFESMKVKGSLQEIFSKSRTWDELIQMFLDNYVCPESKEAVAQIYNREYIMKELRKNYRGTQSGMQSSV